MEIDRIWIDESIELTKEDFEKMAAYLAEHRRKAELIRYGQIEPIDGKTFRLPIASVPTDLPSLPQIAPSPALPSRSESPGEE